jgi:hypothetical protein
MECDETWTNMMKYDEILWHMMETNKFSQLGGFRSENKPGCLKGKHLQETQLFQTDGFRNCVP